jgi:hypothetical protein
LSASPNSPFPQSKIYKEEGKTYAQVLQQVLGVGIDLKTVLVGVESGDLGDVLVLPLTLLLLELEGDTTDGSTLNTLHQVGGVPSNLNRLSEYILPGRPLCKNKQTLFLSLLEAMMAISSQILLLVSKSRVSLG